MSAPLRPAELIGASCSVLLTLRWAGGEWRFTDGDRPDASYLPMATVQIERSFGLLSGDSGPASVPIDIAMPSDVDVPALAEQGHDLAAATAEVSLWISSRSVSARIVVVDGRLIEPAYDADGRIVAAVSDATPAPRTWPEASAYVTSETWSLRDPAVEGRVYPTVFGRPGVYTSADSGEEAYTTGSPGLLVERVQGWVLIAGHPVDATEVTLFKLSGTNSPVSDVVSVVHGEDELGRAVAYVECPAGPGGPTVEEGASYWIRWHDGGGLSSPATGRSLRGAGEILSWWLARSSIRWDRQGWAVAQAALDRYVFAGYVDDWVDPADMIASFADLLPVSIVPGPAGATPILWDAQDRAVVATITDEDGAWIDGIQYDGRDVANEIRISFAPRADADEMLRTKRVTGEPLQTYESRDVIRTSYSRASYAAFGRAPGGDIDAPWVSEEATADRILQWRAAHLGFPRRIVTILASADWAWLSLGAAVRIVSSRYALDRVGIVVGWALSGRALALQIAIQRGPMDAA